MEMINLSESTVKKDCTSLISRCDEYMHLHPHSKIWLRDTDHQYAPIRLETENVPPKHYEELLSLCPKCGFSIQKKTKAPRYYEDYGFQFCDFCYALEEEDGWTQTIRFLSYLNRIDKNNSKSSVLKDLFCNYFSRRILTTKYVASNNEKKYDAERFRIRVLTSNGQLLYLTLNHIRMDTEGNLYVSHSRRQHDKVRFAGVYIKQRDKNGQRLYQGDIVQFEFINHEKRIKWKGVLRNKKKKGDALLYLIEDNLHNNFPINPDSIINDSIEVLGNIFEMKEVMGYNASLWYDFILRDTQYPSI